MRIDARYEIVVVGGSALLALGLVARATADVDLVALRAGQRLLPVDPLPAALAARWTRSHDPSDGFRMVLDQVLAAFGVEDAAIDA